MKRVILALVALVGIALVSCNSIDSKIGRLEKACKAGDLEKATKISADLEKQADKITDEQAIKIANAAMECSKSAMKNSAYDIEDEEDDD